MENKTHIMYPEEFLKIIKAFMKCNNLLVATICIKGLSTFHAIYKFDSPPPTSKFWKGRFIISGDGLMFFRVGQKNKYHIVCIDTIIGVFYDFNEIMTYLL